MSDFSDWFRSVPFFTRYWMASTVGFTLLGRFGIISPYNLILLYEPLKRFQIWRIFTSVLYYPLSPQTGLEEGTYEGRPADYAFMLTFNCLLCVIVGIIAEMPLLMDPMVLSVLYIWCQLNKDTIVNFWFGTRFKAVFLPWVLLLFNMVVNSGGIMELVGIFVGHLYFFLMFKYPQEMGGPVLLQTPSFFKTLFPDQVGGVHGFGVPPERPSAGAGGHNFGGGRNWGRGHVLGGN